MSLLRWLFGCQERAATAEFCKKQLAFNEMQNEFNREQLEINRNNAATIAGILRMVEGRR